MIAFACEPKKFGTSIYIVGGKEMRKLKKFAASLALIGIMCGAAACGDDESTKRTERTTETTEAISEPAAKSTETTEATVDTEATEDTETTEDTGAGATAPQLTYDVNFSTNDWTTLEFAWDGIVYNFPMTYRDVVDAGFTIDEDYLEETLDSYEYTTSIFAENAAGERVYVRFKNFTEEDGRPLSDCEIYGFGFELDEFMDVNPAVTICNGITFGMTVDEVKAIMGEPDYYYSSDDPDFDRKELDYYAEDRVRSNELKLEFHDGILDKISIVNTD